MKILHVLPTLSSGGAERFVTDLTNELTKYDDCQVTVLILKSDQVAENIFYRNELSEKVTFKSLGIQKVRIYDLWRIYQAVKRVKPDIVHYHLAGTLNLMLLTILLYRKPTYIETIHSDIRAIIGITKRDRWIKSFVFKKGLVKVCTITPSNGEAFKEYYRRDCAATIVNGRKAAAPSPLFDKRKKEIESFKHTPNTMVFTHIGRFTKAKNQKLLITAFNNFVHRGNDAILLIIGNGFDSPQGKDYQAHACDSIHFLGEQHDVQDYLMNSDGFCLSSIFEGMPITLIEAFAYGCIPISTPVCGATDYIQDGKNGFLARDFKKESYIEAMERFATHYQDIDKNQLKELYNTTFSIESCANQYHALYKKLSC